MSFASTATEEERKTLISEYCQEQLPLMCTLLVCDAASNIICGKLSLEFDQLTCMNVTKLKELVRSSSWLTTRTHNNNKSNAIGDGNNESVRLAYYVIDNTCKIKQSNTTFVLTKEKKKNDKDDELLDLKEEEENFTDVKEEIEQNDTFFDNDAVENAKVNNAKHFNKNGMVNFPLKPLESNTEDWHKLCQDIITHGCKSIRLVIAYSTEQQRGINELENSEIEETYCKSDDNEKEKVNHQPIRKSLLMVKCNINPTEIQITGNVEWNTLESLRRAIFTKCNVCHSYLLAIQGVISQTTDKHALDKTNEVIINGVTLWQYLPMFEQFVHKRSEREDTENSYVIKLHCFHFTKADEEVLQKCVKEVLTECEQCTPVRVETAQLYSN